MKKIIAIIVNCLLLLFGLLLIASKFYMPAHLDNGLFGSRCLTLNQDITIFNSNYDDSSITLQKGTIVKSDMIIERGVLYTEDNNGVHYHEYIPLEFFVEGDELKAELNGVVENNQNLRRKEIQEAMFKILPFSVIYLVLAVTATIISIKKKKHLVSVLINIILILSVLIVCSFIR